MPCLAWRVASVALTLSTDVLHLFQPTFSLGPSRRLPPLPPLPLSVSPRSPLPQPLPPHLTSSLSHWHRPRLSLQRCVQIQLVCITLGCSETAAVSERAAVDAYAHTHVHTEKPQQESLLNALRFILSSPNCLCLIRACHL